MVTSEDQVETREDKGNLSELSSRGIRSQEGMLVQSSIGSVWFLNTFKKAPDIPEWEELPRKTKGRSPAVTSWEITNLKFWLSDLITLSNTYSQEKLKRGPKQYGSQQTSLTVYQLRPSGPVLLQCRDASKPMCVSPGGHHTYIRMISGTVTVQTCFSFMVNLFCCSWRHIYEASHRKSRSPVSCSQMWLLFPILPCVFCGNV